MAEDLTKEQAYAQWYPGCEDKLVDIEIRKDAKST